MKYLNLLFLGILSLFGSNYLIAQEPTPLYAGHVRWTSGGNELDEIDTTGGAFTVVGTVILTSDFGSVSGVYGLATDPTDDQMYVLYQSSGGSSARRLGLLDPMTGSISDIGNSGNLVDIGFGPDGQLYGTTGSYSSDYSFMAVDKVTATTTLLFDHVSGNWGGSIAYDPFADEMIHVAASNRLSYIDLDSYVETSGSPSGLSSEIQAIVVLEDDKVWATNWGSRYQFNQITQTYSYSGSMDTYHAMAFGPPPCNELTVTASATALCEGEEVTLNAESASGGTITWTGGVTDEVPFLPGPPGIYEYTPSSDSDGDCEVTEPISIEVIGLPTVIAGAGDLIFCEDESITLSAGGDADLYIWEDGDPLDLTPGIGTYTFNLTGYYTEGGCLGENTDEVTVEVVALPTITATASDSPICFNNEVTFTAGGGVEYEWDNGVVDGEPYTPAALGVTTYTVYGTDANGCSNMASVDVEVVEPVSITGVVTEEIAGGDGAIDITISGGAPAYTFDWDNDGTGDFDDTEDLTGLTPGEYTVIVQSDAGCGTSYTFEVGSQVSVDEFGNALINVYPNPTQDNVNIELAGAFNFEIVSINGEVILSGTANDKKVVSMKEFADGVYFINVKSDTTSTTVKVVKK